MEVTATCRYTKVHPRMAILLGYETSNQQQGQVPRIRGESRCARDDILFVGAGWLQSKRDSSTRYARSQ